MRLLIRWSIKPYWCLVWLSFKLVLFNLLNLTHLFFFIILQSFKFMNKRETTVWINRLDTWSQQTIIKSWRYSVFLYRWVYHMDLRGLKPYSVSYFLALTEVIGGVIWSIDKLNKVGLRAINFIIWLWSWFWIRLQTVTSLVSVSCLEHVVVIIHLEVREGYVLRILRSYKKISLMSELHDFPADFC